jgi:hypothetical protein
VAYAEDPEPDHPARDLLPIIIILIIINSSIIIITQRPPRLTSCCPTMGHPGQFFCANRY